MVSCHSNYAKEGFMKSVWVSLLAVLLMVAAAVAFGTGSSEDAKDTKGTIGFSVFDMQYGFFQQMEKGTKDGVTELGYGYILHDQKSDEGLMVSGAIDLINQGIDALIISPIKPEAMGPVVAAAKAKGIPVVVDDNGGHDPAGAVSNGQDDGRARGQASERRAIDV
jgi:ribose transport system substrate-binding protein